MGEIKSTLDLVLEKTRHLTLSDEEKHRQKQKEVRKQLAGLLQRYQDQLLQRHRIGEELDRLVDKVGGLDESVIREEIIARIDIEGENERWFALLQTRYRLDTTELHSIQKGFHSAVAAAADRRGEEIKKELQQTGRISGSAVVPNLNADPSWHALHQSIASKFGLQLTTRLEEISKDL